MMTVEAVKAVELTNGINTLRAEVQRLKEREQDLLEANNRYLQEARDARAELTIERRRNHILLATQDNLCATIAKLQARDGVGNAG